MTKRIQEALFIRAEREIALGNLDTAKQTLVELFDAEKETGSISERLYNLVKEVA